MMQISDSVEKNIAADNHTRKATINLFVLIDALGWTYIKDGNFLNDVLPYRQPLQTVLGFSSGAIPSILTGVSPARNGHWNLFYYDPQNSPFRWLRALSFLPSGLLDNRYGRRFLRELGRRVLGLGPLFECCVSPQLLPLFNYIEKKCIYEPGGITGSPSIFDRLKAEGKPFHVYSYHQYSDRKALEQAKADVREHGSGFYFLYLSEFDGVLHQHCNDRNKVEERLRFYEDQLRALLQIARSKDPDAAMSVFSDHGMTPVHTHYDLHKDIESVGLVMPDDYLAVYDSTMVRMWFFNEDARVRMTEMLSRSSCGRTLSDAELESLGIYFPDHRYGELVFLLHPGWLMVKSDFHGPQWMPTGMHGYHPEDEYSDGIFLSSAPLPAQLRSVTDVYHCMRAVV